MIEEKKSIAIITARGGSKRIPRKNIKNFLGKPIIEYSIHAALNSNCFDEVMVSTDDNEIAELAISCGAKVPFFRSDKNADDFSTTADVITEVLEKYIEMRQIFEFACCIYPTAPFITGDKLKTAFLKIQENNIESVVPVVRFSAPILRSFKMENEFVKLNWPEHINVRSQDLPPAFHDAGQFYFFKVKEFLKTKKLFTEKTIGIEVPEMEVQDIDTEEDWRIAEIKYEFMRNKKNG